MTEKNISAVNLRFGQNLSELRKKNKMSMRDLADKLSVSQTAVWYYEKGERTPTLEVILQLSELFAVSVDTLLKADVRQNQSENPVVPGALILDGIRYNFNFDRAEIEKTQKPFTITISPTEAIK